MDYLTKFDSRSHRYCYRLKNEESTYDYDSLKKSNKEIYNFVTNNSKRIISGIALFFKNFNLDEYIIYISTDYDYWGEDQNYIRSICLITNFGSVYFEHNTVDIVDKIEKHNHVMIPKKIMDILTSNFSTDHKKYKKTAEKIRILQQNLQRFHEWNSEKLLAVDQKI